MPSAELQTRTAGVSAKEARRRERRAKVLERAPAIAALLADGTVSAEHADALADATWKLEPELVEAFFARQQSLADDARWQRPDVFRRTCRDLVMSLLAQAGVDRDARQRRDTSLSRRIDLDGMHHITAVLHPELGAAVFAALDAEVASLVAAGGDEGRSLDRGRLAAEALGNLVAGGHQRQRPGVPEIVAIFDGLSLCDHDHEPAVSELWDGTPVLPDTIRRWCCQGRIIPIVTDQHGNPFDMGREIRVANRAQKRALRTLYRCCAFDGCDIAFDQCEIHHVLPWELGGPTDLTNLLPLCSRHHHLVHEGGWRLELDAQDRTLRIWRPDDQLHAICRPHTGPPGRRPKHRRHRQPQPGIESQPQALVIPLAS